MSISQDAGSLPDVLSSPQINLRLHVNLAQGQLPPAAERGAVLRRAAGRARRNEHLPLDERAVPETRISYNTHTPHHHLREETASYQLTAAARTQIKLFDVLQGREEERRTTSTPTRGTAIKAHEEKMLRCSGPVAPALKA